MEDKVKKDIILVLNNLAKILKAKEEGDIAQIKELSNHIIHDASIFQDQDSISVAILIYSLSKIIERKQDFDYGKIISMVNSCILSILNNNDDSFRKSIKGILDFIRTLDQRLNMYMQEVITQAQIKKGAKICEHGISCARSAEMLGITQWELLRYIGQTTHVDHLYAPVNVSKRIKLARGLFS